MLRVVFYGFAADSRSAGDGVSLRRRPGSSHRGRRPASGPYPLPAPPRPRASLDECRPGPRRERRCGGARGEAGARCGSKCGGGGLEVRVFSYGVRFLPRIHREDLDWFGTRDVPRGRGPPCVMQANRTPVPMAVSSPSGGLHRHEHDGWPRRSGAILQWTRDSRAVDQGG